MMRTKRNRNRRSGKRRKRRRKKRVRKKMRSCKRRRKKRRRRKIMMKKMMKKRRRGKRIKRRKSMSMTRSGMLCLDGSQCRVRGQPVEHTKQVSDTDWAHFWPICGVNSQINCSQQNQRLLTLKVFSVFLS